jgi:hypothetical protein
MALRTINFNSSDSASSDNEEMTQVIKKTQNIKAKCLEFE